MSENVKRWYVYNGELLSGDEYDPAEDDENLYVPVVFGPGYDALLAERDALRGAGKQINHHLERAKVFLDSERYATCGQEIAGAHAALLAAWRAATGEE